MKDGNDKGTTGGMYRPNGKLQGDTSPMPSKGTGTGVTDTYGADLGPDSCNCIGENISRATRSDGMEAA